MPTQLIKKYVEELARYLRNLESYDDFEYGTEVIPGDKTWAKNQCSECKSCSCKIKDKDKI
jgi:hypothetical protein